MYKPAHKYSLAELRQAEIDDLLVDYRCAVRDNLPEYAAKVVTQFESMGVYRYGVNLPHEDDCDCQDCHDVSDLQR